MDKIKIARELVEVARDLTAGRLNPDVNDIHNATERIMDLIQTLNSAATNLGQRKELQRLQKAAREISGAAAVLAAEWKRAN